MAKKTVEIELVKTEAGYRRALKQVSYFFDHPPAAGSALEAEFVIELRGLSPATMTTL